MVIDAHYSQSGDWIRFDEKTGRFSLVPKEEETGVGGSPHTEGSGAEDLGKIQRKHSVSLRATW